MKLVSYFPSPRARTPRLGALVDRETSSYVLDLARASAWALSLRIPPIPSDMLAFLRMGKRGISLAHEAVVRALSGWRDLPDGAAVPLGNLRLTAPIPRPGKIICIGLNYFRHLMEVQGPAARPPEVPRGFLKASSCVVGPDEPVAIPSWTQQFDYEVELAVVIGTPGVNIPAGKALDHVAGYVVLNDLSAREVQKEEMKKGLLCLGKNFPGAAPMGPYILTAGEVPNPHALEIELRVNGELRQKSHTGDLIHKVPDAVAYWSRMGLEVGDIISTGTPSGVAMGREPDLSWYLKPGDVVEATIERLGTLRTPIAAK
jgi:acylpyruvate hydrolase